MSTSILRPGLAGQYDADTLTQARHESPPCVGHVFNPAQGLKAQ